VLYSIQYIRNKRNERQLFYADSDAAALEKIREYAKKNERIYELRHREKHICGLWLNGRFFPAEEKKRERV
jgi:hypothetical protein